MALSDRIKGEIVEAVLAAASRAYDAGRADERADMAAKLGLAPPPTHKVERLIPSRREARQQEEAEDAASYGGITNTLRKAFFSFGRARAGVAVSAMFDHARELDGDLDDTQLRTALRALMEQEEIERTERGFYRATDKLIEKVAQE